MTNPEKLTVTFESEELTGIRVNARVRIRGEERSQMIAFDTNGVVEWPGRAKSVEVRIERLFDGFGFELSAAEIASIRAQIEGCAAEFVTKPIASIKEVFGFDENGDAEYA